MRIYETKQGDMLDLICYRLYDGRQAGAVEAVLEANQPINLSQYPERLPRGLKITLPDLPNSATALPLLQRTRLWD
jgi:phage tail protein X